MAQTRREESTQESKESKDDDGGKINGLQIAAASGAASTGALVAHALGIYGTVAGVALFSVVSSVGTVLYLKSMHRTREKLRKVVKQVNTTKMEKTAPAADPAVDATQVITQQNRPDPDATVAITRQQRHDPDATQIIARQEADSTRPLPGAGESGSSDEEPQSFPARLRDWWQRYWKPVAATSAAAFVLSLALLTGIAWVSGQPPTQYYNGNTGDSAPEPQPTPGDEEAPGDDTPTSPRSEDPEGTDPSPQPSEPQEPTTEGDGGGEQPQEPSTQPDDPGTGDEEPQESPQDEGNNPEQQSRPSHDGALTR